MPRQSQRECKAVVRHDAMDELDDEDDENAPESSEEALEEDGGDDNDGDDDDDDEEEEEEDVNKPAVVLKKRKRNYAKARHVCTKDGLVPLSTRPNKKRKKKDYVIDEKLEALPTYTRKTTHGGYAHTNLSRSRISESNSGNTPWNYGKQRSSADKAKIAAGVRARNHTILLEKLENLGLTEEEWIKKKKEIKHLREKLRKAKLTNMKSETELHSKILQEALDATDEKKMKEIKVNNYYIKRLLSMGVVLEL
jgi:Fe2+ transport system protein FeoA